MKQKLLCFLFTCLLLYPFSVSAQHKEKKEETMHVYKDSSGFAIGGYDPVAYFTDNEAKKGKSEFHYEYQNATWLFVSKSHLLLFKKSPLKYLPQYGGYCAYGIGHGAGLVSTDPQAWSIIQGKLYFNLNKKYREIWEMNVDKNIRSGDTGWKRENAQQKK